MEFSYRPRGRKEQALIDELFGDSDEEREREQPSTSPSTSGRQAGGAGPPGPLQDAFGIAGLCLVDDFLTAAQQEALLSSMVADGYLTLDRRATNQAMRFFGSAPQPRWLLDLAHMVRGAALPLWPPELSRRAPLFNQCIVNSYFPGQGITPHVDLASFADGIASVSLLSPIVIDFRCCSSGELTEVLLCPGDLLLMSGPARYEFTHGIEARAEDSWGGEARPRGHRVSITLRRMRSDVHELTEPAAAEAGVAGSDEEESGNEGTG